MSYLLDTIVLSELRKGPRGNPHVATWFAPVPDHGIYLSVLVIGEIRWGIERIRSRDLPRGHHARGLANAGDHRTPRPHIGGGPRSCGGMGAHDGQQALINRR